MKIEILNLKRQYNSIKNEIDEAIRRVVNDQNFVLGQDVKSLEQEIASYCGTKYAVGVASGTDALILALRALDIKTGDEVITVPFTFFATAEVISLVGAKPVFVDIDPKTYNMDPSKIEAKITKATKAIIPVHLYGQCCDMEHIKVIAKKHSLKIIEDNAQSIGATYDGNKSGSMGDVGCLSFFPSKNLGGFGDGGMVVTNDENIAKKIAMLRVHGSIERYIHSVIGMNSRLDNLQAAVLRVKLKYLDKWLDARRRIAKYYDNGLKGLPLHVPFIPERNVHTYSLYIVRVPDRALDLMQFLKDNGIETRAYYPIPLHLQKCYQGLHYKDGDFPESEKAAHETLALPIFPELTQSEMDHVVSTVKKFFKR